MSTDPPPSKFLNSKVARRVFAMFFLCAIVPVIVLAAYALREVSGHLRATAAEKLRLASRAHGQGIAERLSLLEIEMMLAVQAQPPSGVGPEYTRMPATLTAFSMAAISSLIPRLLRSIPK